MTYEEYKQLKINEKNMQIERMRLFSDDSPEGIARKKILRAELKKIDDITCSPECFDERTATIEQIKELLAISKRSAFDFMN